jgi:hypothetical protein
LEKETMTRLKYEQGIAVAYLLASIALLTLVAFTMSKMSDSSTSLKVAFDNKITLIRQYQQIRSRILSCGIAYPGGINGTGFRVQYPGTPASGNLADALCPGHPDKDNLWTGRGGMLLPAPPAAFSQWKYINDATSMRLTIQPAATGDAGSIRVLGAVAKRIGSAASMSGEVLSITLMH